MAEDAHVFERHEPNCTHFLSEDLNDGQAYGELVAVDPFRHAPEDVLGRGP
jgi:hypothetical protein